jgi:voltage-gated potassium channel
VIWARRFACRGILHFSYATLTTVGFGDVLPTTVAGRTLAWAEAIMGQLYLAVLIARLVSL